MNKPIVEVINDLSKDTELSFALSDDVLMNIPNSIPAINMNILTYAQNGVVSRLGGAVTFRFVFSADHVGYTVYVFANELQIGSANTNKESIGAKDTETRVNVNIKKGDKITFAVKKTREYSAQYGGLGFVALDMRGKIGYYPDSFLSVQKRE